MRTERERQENSVRDREDVEFCFRSELDGSLLRCVAKSERHAFRVVNAEWPGVPVRLVQEAEVTP